MKTLNGTLMKKRLLLILFGALVPFLCQHAHAQVVIIANPSVKAVDISKDDLRDVFTGASSSLKGGAQVTPVLLKDDAVHQAMLTLYIGKSDAAFRASWRSIVFSGQGAMPKSFDSEAAVVEYVAHTPGAIAYIGKSSPHEGVKILAIK
jgi:ABC-type phosphate transport system substrate-binding protein